MIESVIETDCHSRNVLSFLSLTILWSGKQQAIF